MEFSDFEQCVLATSTFSTSRIYTAPRTSWDSPRGNIFLVVLLELVSRARRGRARRDLTVNDAYAKFGTKIERIWVTNLGRFDKTIN